MLVAAIVGGLDQESNRLKGESMNPGPAGTKDNHPASHGTGSCEIKTVAFFRPVGALERFERGFPPLKRWAIVGRPCGTFAQCRSRLNVTVAAFQIRSAVWDVTGRIGSAACRTPVLRIRSSVSPHRSYAFLPMPVMPRRVENGGDNHNFFRFDHFVNYAVRKVS